MGLFLYVDRGGSLKATTQETVMQKVVSSGGKARFVGKCDDAGVDNVNNVPVVGGFCVDVDTIIKGDGGKILAGCHVIGYWPNGQAKSESLKWSPMNAAPKVIRDFLKKYELYFEPLTGQLDYWKSNGMKNYNPL
jgi:hypothetical protein